MKKNTFNLVSVSLIALFIALGISCQENSTAPSKKSTDPAGLYKVSDICGVIPVTYTDLGPGGNVECGQLGTFDFTSGRINYDEETGEFDAPFPVGITVSVDDDRYLSWNFSNHCELIVIVKGGNASNVYTYSKTAVNDAGLAAPENKNGKPAGLGNVTFCWNECPPVIQGCTPGYWKNHTGSWPPTGYSVTQKIQTVFPNSVRFPYLANSILLQALSFGGGPGDQGAAEILLRAAIGALLNAAHPDVNYPRTVASVLTDVNTALSGTRDQMLALAAALDADNNLGCPLN